MRHQLSPVDHLSHFHHRIQCHRLPAGVLIERLVHSANPFHFNTKDSWTTYTVWRVQTRPLRHYRESSRTRLLVICYPLDTLPDGTASLRKQHELRRSAFGSHHCRGITGLDDQWSQEVQDPRSAKIVTASCDSLRRYPRL